MSGVVSYPTGGSRTTPERTAWHVRLRTGGALYLVGVVIAMAALTGLDETSAQDSKPTDKPGSTPAELYGDQGGEKPEAGNARLPNTVMRARKEDTFLKISNPRVGKATGGKGKAGAALLVDFEVVSKGKLNGGAIVFHSENGNRTEVALQSILNKDHGTIELVGVGNAKIPTNATFPQNVELYVVRIDDRFDPPLKFMVSNSLVVGTLKVATRPRDWGVEEIERFVKGPAAYKNPNVHAGIGEDVPPLPPAGGQFRFVDPDGRLLGLDYQIGVWDKRNAVGRMTPVFSADQPKQHAARSIARKGYAVAGAEVNTDKFFCGIRLLFQRVKQDGTLDEKDAYAGDWIGTPPATGEPTKLVNDGRRLLGIHIQQGAIVDHFALVVEAKAK